MIPTTKNEKQWLETALVSAKTMATTQDLDLRYIWVSNPFDRFIENDPLGKTDEEIWPVKEAGKLTKIKQQVLKSGEGNKEVFHRVNQGKQSSYQLTVQPLYQEDGKIQGISSTFTEITQPKIWEEELAKVNFNYQALFNSMNEAVAIHEMVYDEHGHIIDFVITEVNQAYKNHVGIPHLRSIEQGGKEKFDNSPYLNIYKKVVSTKKLEAFEVYFPPLKKYLNVVAFYLGPGKFGKVFHDISQKKQTEEQLVKYENRFKIIQDVGKAILTAQSSQEISEVFLNHIDLLYDLQRTSVFTFRPDGKAGVVLADHIKGLTFTEAGTELPLDLFGNMKDLRKGKIHTVTNIRDVSPPSPRVAVLLEKGVQAYVVIPLNFLDSLVGCLHLGSKELGDFSSPYIKTIKEISDTLAVALFQAQLRESLIKKQQELRSLSKKLRTVEEEQKRRLARELHDQVGQNLTALNINLSILKVQLSPEVDLQCSDGMPFAYFFLFALP